LVNSYGFYVKNRNRFYSYRFHVYVIFYVTYVNYLRYMKVEITSKSMGTSAIHDWEITCKALHGMAPPYLGPFVRAADLPSRRALYGQQAPVAGWSRPSSVPQSVAGPFSVSGSRMWNELPEDVATAPSLPICRRWLKTYLFQKSYPDILIWRLCRHFRWSL